MASTGGAGCTSSLPAAPDAPDVRDVPDAQFDARFADATQPQIERAYLAASGGDLYAYFFVNAALAGQSSPASCPRIMTSGQDTTITGGCSNDGTLLEGSVTLHNVPGVPVYNPSEPSTITFDFKTTAPESTHSRVDGHIGLYGSRISGDLTVLSQGIVSTSRVTLARSLDGTRTLSPGSEIEISDVGRAGVEGTWNESSFPSGSFTLRGADVVVFDVSRRDEASCVPYTIGENHGTVCVAPVYRQLPTTTMDRAAAPLRFARTRD